MAEETLEAVYHRLLDELDRIAQAAGRPSGAVRLLAVSKTFPAEAIEELYRAGHRAFGENRIAELEAKAARLPSDIEWHLIGQLQGNKVRKAVRVASVIHSVDSLPLLERVDRIAGEEGRCPKILLEVNISGEASKSGCTPTELDALAAAAAAAEHLQFCGLMTMAPADAAGPELTRIFGGLAAERDRLEKQLGIRLPELSMGMSGDYPEAIRQGATIVRVGTLLFGNRIYAAK